MTFRSRHARAFVLLSGGIDSATTLWEARGHFIHVTAVSFDYGQRHLREVQAARALCEVANVKHIVLRLPGVLSGPDVMLTNSTVEIPKISYAEIKGVSPTYVPFRNGTMLSVLAAHASKHVMEAAHVTRVGNNSPLLKDLVTLYFGAHAEDAKDWAYPDCTPEFVGSMANAIYTGTYQTVRLVAPFIYSSKAQIIRRGADLGVPFRLTWSCYAGGEKHCGECPTCRARKGAFHAAGVDDPTEYAV